MGNIAKAWPCSPKSDSQGLPTYDESVHGPETGTSLSSKSTSEGLETRLAIVQSDRILQVIDHRIMPSILEHVETGIFRATFVLIQRQEGLLEDQSRYTLTNFDEDEYVRLVRLDRDAQDGRFWRQPRIIALLEDKLREQLIASGIKLVAENARVPISSLENEAKTRSSFWKKGHGNEQKSRMFSSGSERPNRDMNDTGGTLNIVFEEVRVRVLTDMDLYETIGCPAIVVRLQIGAQCS